MLVSLGVLDDADLAVGFAKLGAEVDPPGGRTHSAWLEDIAAAVIA